MVEVMLNVQSAILIGTNLISSKAQEGPLNISERQELRRFWDHPE